MKDVDSTGGISYLVWHCHLISSRTANDNNEAVTGPARLQGSSRDSWEFASPHLQHLWIFGWNLSTADLKGEFCHKSMAFNLWSQSLGALAKWSLKGEWKSSICQEKDLQGNETFPKKSKNPCCEEFLLPLPNCRGKQQWQLQGEGV